MYLFFGGGGTYPGVSPSDKTPLPPKYARGLWDIDGIHMEVGEVRRESN